MIGSIAITVRTHSYKNYDLTEGEGYRVWQKCLARGNTHLKTFYRGAESQERYGSPQSITPRLGQGTFRVAVTEAYSRACAITYEHSLPALEAAHIRPHANRVPHAVSNGLLLRADLHRLFDQGYITVTPEYRVEISHRLKEDYQNGRSYYPLHGTLVHLPGAIQEKPNPDYLRWHNENVYRTT
jgi:putative restriction endonuclease